MAETPQEKSEAARVRRRWLNLGELLAIVAVAISALTLWNSYRERTNTEAEHRIEAARTSHAAAVLVLKATPDRDGRTLALSPRTDAQVIQSQTITFPTILGLPPVDTTGEARIERGWFDTALVKSRKAAGASHDRAGDARMPILITTHFLVNGEEAIDRGLFELGYEAGHGFLTGTSIKLKGLSHVATVRDHTTGQSRLDTMAKGRLG